MDIQGLMSGHRAEYNKAENRCGEVSIITRSSPHLNMVKQGIMPVKKSNRMGNFPMSPPKSIGDL
ncbi:hypothetical protein ACMFMG_008887 [Clarireedia jacksonii]